jgi:hypothetical protein
VFSYGRTNRTVAVDISKGCATICASASDERIVHHPGKQRASTCEINSAIGEAEIWNGIACGRVVCLFYNMDFLKVYLAGIGKNLPFS